MSARATIREEIGRQALADGHILSARKHLITADVCYLFPNNHPYWYRAQSADWMTAALGAR